MLNQQQLMKDGDKKLDSIHKELVKLNALSSAGQQALVASTEDLREATQHLEKAAQHHLLVEHPLQ